MILNGVPLPIRVFEKVVKCWGYTLVRRMGKFNWRSREQDWELPRYPLNTHRKEEGFK